ncbi:MAG: SPFH domain-containing protein [Parcubacteria group bacterium]
MSNGDPVESTGGSRPKRSIIKALRNVTTSITPTFSPERKNHLVAFMQVILFVAWIALLYVVRSNIVWDLAIFVVVMFFFGSTVVPEAHRGLLVFLGRRVPIALPEGLVFFLPFICRVKPIDVRERDIEIPILHLSADGMTMKFALRSFFHPARSRDEVRTFWKWFDGTLLLAYDNLRERVDEDKIRSLVSQAVETLVSTYRHDELIGISVYQLLDNLRTSLEQGAPVNISGVVHQGQSDIATAIRIQVVEKVHESVAPVLRHDGIVVTVVPIARIDFDERIQEKLNEILSQWIEKLAQSLDVAGDIQRANQMVAAAKAAGEDLPFSQAYSLVRRYDNDETAAKLGLPAHVLTALSETLRSKAA